MQQSWDNTDARDDENEIRYSLTALGEAALEDVRAGVPSFCGFEPCVAPIGQVADRRSRRPPATRAPRNSVCT